MSPATTGSSRRTGRNTDDRSDRLLSALADSDCRSILGATADDALSAKEVAERCDVPLSTTYRKLERLTAADLLEERLRIRRSGKHTSEYVCPVDDVHVPLTGDKDIALVADGARTGVAMTDGGR